MLAFVRSRTSSAFHVRTISWMTVALIALLGAPGVALGMSAEVPTPNVAESQVKAYAIAPSSGDSATLKKAAPARETVVGGPVRNDGLVAASAIATGPIWFFDGFESGSVSTYWTVTDPITWGTSTFERSAGTFSAWCLGAYYDYYGDFGYPNNYLARMARGPYNLSKSSGQTVLKTALWVDSQAPTDRAKILVSTDGQTYYGNYITGAYGYWGTATLDLKNVYTLGDVSKSPNLYVMLSFSSGATDYWGEGVYFDDVTLKDMGPDLVVSNVSCAPSTRAGMTVAIADKVENRGASVASTFSVSYYLSSDANISPSDLRLGGRGISSLAAGSADSGTGVFTVPAGLGGTYYVGGIVDSGGTVSEAIEDNNACVGSQIYVAPTVYPTSFVRSGPASVYVSRTYKLSGTVRPSGARGRVTARWQRYYSGSYHTVKTSYVTLTGSTFYSTYKPGKRGKWRVRLDYPGQTTPPAIFQRALPVYKAFYVK